MMRFAVSDQTIDVASLRAELHAPRHGGFCAFEGWVRDSNEGRAVDGLEYEIYAELAQSEGDRILEEAHARFGAIDAVGIHRSGMLRIGEMAVWVGVSSAHRDEAFRACRFIIDQIKHRLPVWKKEHYLEGDTAWVACSHPAAEDDHSHGHAHDNAHGHHHHDAPAHASPFVPDYSRQMRLPEVGESGQARLAASRVLVIGAGGLGSPVLTYLAGAGVGTVTIVDHDRVERSNLHRQTLYRAGDVGREKAQVAAERLREINPSIRVEPVGKKLHPSEAMEMFARFDLVIECSDDMRSRYLSSDAAVLSGTTTILASVHQYEGQMQVVRGGGGPCLRCLWPEEPAPGVAGSCEESGVLGPVPGVLGAMQANEALKLLLGQGRKPEREQGLGSGRSSDGSLLLVDLLENSTQRLAIDTSQGCVTRGGCAAVARRALAEGTMDIDLRFERLEAALTAGFHLVDVRNADELAAEPLPVTAQWLPLPVLAERAGELPSGEPILLVCASGRRSAHGARQLRAAGLESVFSWSGGLHGVGQP